MAITPDEFKQFRTIIKDHTDPIINDVKHVTEKLETLATKEICELKHSGINARVKKLERKATSSYNLPVVKTNNNSGMVKVVSIVVGAMVTIILGIIGLVKVLA